MALVDDGARAVAVALVAAGVAVAVAAPCAAVVPALLATAAVVPTTDATVRSVTRVFDVLVAVACAARSGTAVGLCRQSSAGQGEPGQDAERASRKAAQGRVSGLGEQNQGSAVLDDSFNQAHDTPPVALTTSTDFVSTPASGMLPSISHSRFRLLLARPALTIRPSLTTMP